MTIGDWLEQLAESDTSSEDGWGLMQTYLRKSGMTKAVVTYGVVYPEGYGPPLSINKMAEVVMESWRSGVK